jgi:hypothetical protein
VKAWEQLLTVLCALVLTLAVAAETMAGRLDANLDSGTNSARVMPPGKRVIMDPLPSPKAKVSRPSQQKAKPQRKGKHAASGKPKASGSSQQAAKPKGKGKQAAPKKQRPAKHRARARAPVEKIESPQYYDYLPEPLVQVDFTELTSQVDTNVSNADQGAAATQRQNVADNQNQDLRISCQQLAGEPSTQASGTSCR